MAKAVAQGEKPLAFAEELKLSVDLWSCLHTNLQAHEVYSTVLHLFFMTKLLADL